MELTTEVVRELLDYDKETGVFTWRARDRSWFKIGRDCEAWNARFCGSLAGYVNRHNTGYPQVFIRVISEKWLAHRLAFLWMGKALPDQVDHLNRDSSDNSWKNLVASSAKENMKNMSKRTDNKSGVTGVSWSKRAGKWVARVGVAGERKHLGYFEDLEVAGEAVEAFRAANGFSSGHGKNHAKYIKKPVDSVI